MGREASGRCHWAGQSGVAKVLLEPHEIILRGGIKARILRASITAFSAHGEDLVLETLEGQLVASLGAKEAGKWVEALARPLPSLASKLGIGGTSPAWLFGETDDEALCEALAGHHSTANSDDAALIVAMIDGPTSLDAAMTLAGDRHLWCVYPKGKAAGFGDTAIRSHLRGAGWSDSKSCAVSDRLTATRYRRK